MAEDHSTQGQPAGVSVASGRRLVAVRYGGRRIGLYRVKQEGGVGLLLNHGGISFPVGTRLDVGRVANRSEKGQLSWMEATVVDNTASGLRLAWCHQETPIESAAGMNAAGAELEGREALLALDGRCLERLALPLAVELCQGACRRLDILLSHPPRAAITKLGSFLMALEEQGIDYRLTSADKDLHVELAPYLRRFPTVSVILLDCLENWDEDHLDTLDTLRAEGYRVISLLDHRKSSPGPRVSKRQERAA